MAIRTKREALAKVDEGCPDDFSWHEALYSLYALQHYESMHKVYDAGVFYTQIFSCLAGLENTSRKTLLSHLEAAQCVVCMAQVQIGGKALDHIIPLSMRGPDTMENMMVLCPQHNSSKGSKDLLAWWLDKDWKVTALPRNILCLYARLMWKHLDAVLADPYDVPHAVIRFLTHRAAGLPSAEHRLALYGSTYAAMAFRHWEHAHAATSRFL